MGREMMKSVSAEGWDKYLPRVWVWVWKLSSLGDGSCLCKPPLTH